MVTAFVDMLGLIIIYPLLPFYATRLGANAATVGALVAAFSVAQLVSAPAWGWMSDRYGRRPAILVGLIVSAVAYVIFAFADSLWLLFLSRVIQGLGGGTIGVVQAYVTDITGGKDRAKALGWLSAVTSLGAVVGPALGSLLVSVGGRTAPGSGLQRCAFSSAFLRGGSLLSRARSLLPLNETRLPENRVARSGQSWFIPMSLRRA